MPVIGQYVNFSLLFYQRGDRAEKSCARAQSRTRKNSRTRIISRGESFARARELARAFAQKIRSDYSMFQIIQTRLTMNYLIINLSRKYVKVIRLSFSSSLEFRFSLVRFFALIACRIAHPFAHCNLQVSSWIVVKRASISGY